MQAKVYFPETPQPPRTTFVDNATAALVCWEGRAPPDFNCAPLNIHPIPGEWSWFYSFLLMEHPLYLVMAFGPRVNGGVNLFCGCESFIARGHSFFVLMVRGAKIVNFCSGQWSNFVTESAVYVSRQDLEIGQHDVQITLQMMMNWQSAVVVYSWQMCPLFVFAIRQYHWLNGSLHSSMILRIDQLIYIQHSTHYHFKYIKC